MEISPREETRDRRIKRFVKYELNRSFSIPNPEFIKEEDFINPNRCNALQYARFKDIPDSLTYDSISKYSKLIIEKYNEIGVYKIFSNYKRLGEFVIFHFNKTNKPLLLYVPDTNKVNYEH